MLGLALGCQSHGADVGKDKGHAPTIVDSYATSVIRPGKTWRIYLYVRDDDGDKNQKDNTIFPLLLDPIFQYLIQQHCTVF
jgi:hypothetical protein